MVNLSLKYPWLTRIMWQILMSNEAKRHSHLEKWGHKLLKSNKILNCVMTGYRLISSLQKKMHEGIQQLSCLIFFFLDKFVFCIKKWWFFNCHSCRITSVSGHQNKLSSFRAPVATRQLKSCTSFVFNFCNCCTSGLYISNVYYHSSATQQVL